MRKPIWLHWILAFFYYVLCTLRGLLWAHYFQYCHVTHHEWYALITLKPIIFINKLKLRLDLVHWKGLETLFQSILIIVGDVLIIGKGSFASVATTIDTMGKLIARLDLAHQKGPEIPFHGILIVVYHASTGREVGAEFWKSEIEDIFTSRATAVDTMAKQIVRLDSAH